MRRVPSLFVEVALIAAMVAPLAAALAEVGASASPETGKVYRVAWTESDSGYAARYVRAFRDRLAERGYREGVNVQVRPFRKESDEREVRLSPDRMRAVVEWKPHAIVVVGADTATAFRKAAPGAPVIFTWAPDPVAAGLVESLSRPGGNATGVSIPLQELAVKRIVLLPELLPKARRIAVLFDSRTAEQAGTLSAMRSGAQRRKLQLKEFDMAKEGLEATLSRIGGWKADAVLITGVLDDPGFLDPITRFQMRTRVPVLDDTAESAEDGMVLALGEDGRDHFRRAADTTVKVLQGADPATIPVNVSSRISLWVNAGAARKLNIHLPESVLARADRVIP